MLCELGYRRKTRHQIVLRQSLRLVEYYHAVCDVVQLPASAAAVGIKRLKELHSGRDDHGGVPVFAGKQLAVLRRRKPICLYEPVFRGGVVGEDVFFAQKLAENVSGLIYN